MDTAISYCRLCAKEKTRSKLTDLQVNVVAFEEIIKKLTRLNCHLDFEEKVLPKTVCLSCFDALQRAFNFIAAVEKAQVELKEIITPQSVKKEDDSSCSEDYIFYVPADENFDDNIDIKCEIMTEESSIEPISVYSNTETSITTHRSYELAGIPFSQLQLTWNDYDWMCSYCETKFRNISELRTHSIDHHDVCNAYQCTDCKIKKLSLVSFLSHIREHRKYLEMSCYKCGQHFPSTQEVKKHQLEHDATKFKCLGCNACFISLNELHKHVRKYYKKYETYNVTCLNCKKIFLKKTTMQNHLIHTNKKQDHFYDICGKCLYAKRNLANKASSHEDKDRFSVKFAKLHSD